MAIDRQTIIDTLRQGWAKVGTSPILSSVWAYAGLEPWPYDPPAAAEILRQHGWQRGADGILTRDGVRFSFTLATDAASRSWRDTAAMIQDQLLLIGIEVLIQPMELNTLLARLGEHDFDATMGSWGIDTSLDLKYAFHTDSIDGGYNFGGYSDPRVDELIDEAKRQLEPRDAGPLLREIQEILHRDQPYTFLWEPQRIAAMAVRLRDARPNSVSTYQNLRAWWIAE